jgi:hypothetical protein
MVKIKNIKKCTFPIAIDIGLIYIMGNTTDREEITMKYSKTFNSSPYYRSQELKDWIAENNVTIHSVKDGGMYGNIIVLYSSPQLTGGDIRIGSAYSSLHGSNKVYFSDNDPIKGVA